nr:MAG TPA: hypothetical protein [Caudoviricetes sp.]
MKKPTGPPTSQPKKMKKSLIVIISQRCRF